jgi:hypothetical protein
MEDARNHHRAIEEAIDRLWDHPRRLLAQEGTIDYARDQMLLALAAAVQALLLDGRED